METHIKTTEQHRIINLVENLSKEELEPIVADLDKTSTFPIELFIKLGDLKILGLPNNKEYGGLEQDLATVSLVIEKLAKISPGFAMSVMVQLGMVEYGMFGKFANQKQKERYLPLLSNGSAIGAFAFTEYQAGSDAGEIKTYAETDGNKYILNGTKTYIANVAADMDSIIIVTAQTGENKDGKKEFSNFIVEKSQSGVSVAEPFEKLGMRISPTSDVFFENVEIDKSNLLGEEKKGLIQSLKVLNIDRILASSLAIGILDRVLEESINYSKKRYQFKEPLKNFQSIQFKIADMASDLKIARSMLKTCLELERNNSSEFISHVASLKLFSTTSAMKHSLEAIQIHGGYGTRKDYPVERFMRDAKLLEIAGGSSEMLKILIANEALNGK